MESARNRSLFLSASKSLCKRTNAATAAEKERTLNGSLCEASHVLVRPKRLLAPLENKRFTLFLFKNGKTENTAKRKKGDQVHLQDE